MSLLKWRGGSISMAIVEAASGNHLDSKDERASAARPPRVDLRDLGGERRDLEQVARVVARCNQSEETSTVLGGDCDVVVCSVHSGVRFEMLDGPWIAVGRDLTGEDRERALSAGAADVIEVCDLAPALLERALSWALERDRFEGELAALRASEEELVRRALFDDLTGLPGRALFLDRLGHCLERAERRGDSPYSVLFLDLDGFKEVNDGFGHDVGDRLLVAVARRLEACVRPGDTVARLAGDEFCVLLEDMHELDDIVRVVERIQQELGRAFAIEGRQVSISSSVGVALGAGDHPRPEDVLRAADHAMYRAKGAGGARWEVHAPSFAVTLDRRRILEDDLRNAVRREEFQVHYQPIVSLESGATEGFEALLRWNHPTRGRLDSSEFIDVLGEMGLIHQLGTWTLHEACRQALSWRSKDQFDEPFVGVNVSARELWRATFADDVRGALTATGLPASALRLEVSEDALAPWHEAGDRALGELRQAGVRVQIDDFGAGAAPLGLLRRRPVDALKFAPAALFSDDERTLKLTRAMIGLAHHLGLTVTAKGVECQTQLERARDLGCDAGQGYLFGEAAAADSFGVRPASA